ncbi:hypothetical protein AWB74_08512 [Caballeronia arvi]|uniref:Uncharacterized protein n=1 Tax=Caballeronia arvi TaxID=1777135 RepID=A0A158L5U1_9BURK|nr:hypothetical protein [Caballeronia arvi]SAL88333.1 hypothetical protein AWB74_08512 [Caballeronia arvi]
MHAHDCIRFSCCATAHNIGVELAPFDYDNAQAVEACLLAAQASLVDIDRALALCDWYQFSALPEPPPCGQDELWRIAGRVYVGAVRLNSQVKESRRGD